MLGGIRTAAIRATGLDEAQAHLGPHVDIDLLLGKPTGSNRIDIIVDKSVQRFMKKASDPQRAHKGIEYGPGPPRHCMGTEGARRQ